MLVPLLTPSIPFRTFPVTTNLFKHCVTGELALPPIPARVAFVKPTFTLTPYYNYGSSFYAFYAKYGSATGAITTDLDWLSTKVTASWSSPSVNEEKPLYDFLTSQVAAGCGLVMGQNLKTIDDVAVNGGALFNGSVRAFDVVILGHEEYVTAGEYQQFKQFVREGGRIVEMSGNTFWAEVNYSAGVETFVVGHGFQFNGTAAWRTNAEPFDVDAESWFGSAFASGTFPVRGAYLNGTALIGSDLAAAYNTTSAFTDMSYPHDEQNFLANFKDTEVIARWYDVVNASSGGGTIIQFPPIPIDAYIHYYGNGSVLCFCAFGENIILSDPMAQYFLISGASLGYAPTYRTYNMGICGPTAAKCSP